MHRTTLWSALLLAVAASTGCGTVPITEAAGKHGGTPHGMPAPMTPAQAPAAAAAPTSPAGFNFVQANVLASLRSSGSSDVTVDQTNRIATLRLDDPDDLLRHYVEMPGEVVWDRTTRSFFLTQANLAASVVSYSDTTFQQLNRLLIIVDRDAKRYNGTIVQLNVLGEVTVTGGSASIAQFNDVTIIHPDEDAPDADDTLAKLTDGPQAPISSATVLRQRHDLIVYIAQDGKPHLYRWQAPTGKNGLGQRRIL